MTICTHALPTLRRRPKVNSIAIVACLTGTVALFSQACSHTGIRPDELSAMPGSTTSAAATADPRGQAIWLPAPGTTWQWQLQGAIDTSLDVDMFDIDLFDAPQAVIHQLRKRGAIVICYFNAGASENWRDDAAAIPSALKGKTNGWPGEQWLDIRDIRALAAVMTRRLELAVAKGCDGVEPDNVDAYVNDSGFLLTAQHQLDYNRWLAEQAHTRGLSIGLKNDLDQVAELEPHFDWALNEQCFEFSECTKLLPFVNAGKAVFGVEYNHDTRDFCPFTNALNFDWLRKSQDLGAERESCR
ncbi:MAG: endo alpha-1,4 polygalactosaminidase [Granulosicoccus sp.]|nr:endo alpha-1,4 polygalactosaminidase [Granulosicoccus sp.]